LNFFNLILANGDCNALLKVFISDNGKFSLQTSKTGKANANNGNGKRFSTREAPSSLLI
jgi:hypothetical protein